MSTAYRSDGNGGVEAFEFEIPISAQAAFEPVFVSKLVVLDRIHALGKFEEAIAVLKANPYMYERWSAADAIDYSDSMTRAMLGTIGLDADIILAP
jgi:hypothetical protein